MRFDYHMHTPLCGHAVGHPREYAAEAVRKGLQEIGFSEHNPMPSKFDDWRMDLADFPEYLRLVEEARLEFPQLPIRLGLECDFIPGKEGWIRELAAKAQFDYFIGAVHYITPDWDVDNPLKLARWKDQPVEEVWTKYFKAMTQAAQSGLFDFMAHPDLVKKFGAPVPLLPGTIALFVYPKTIICDPPKTLHTIMTKCWRENCILMSEDYTPLDLEKAKLIFEKALSPKNVQKLSYN